MNIEDFPTFEEIESTKNELYERYINKKYGKTFLTYVLVSLANNKSVEIFRKKDETECQIDNDFVNLTMNKEEFEKLLDILKSKGYFVSCVGDGDDNDYYEIYI